MWNPFKGTTKVAANDAGGIADMSKVAAAAVAVAIDQIGRAGALDGGLQNLMSGMNTERDKRWYSEYGSPMGENGKLMVDNMVRSSWLAGRIVHSIAEDMTRGGWKLSWDGAETNQNDAKALTDLEDAVMLHSTLDDAITWGRQYGGSGVLIGIKGDERRLSEPLALDSVKKGSLQYLHAFDRWDLSQVGGEVENDLTSPWYGQPTHYQIQNAGNMVPNVHRSRLVLFSGRRLSRRSWRENGYWHDSVLIAAMNSVKNYDTATGGVASMIFEANVDIISVPGLAEMMATDKGRAKLLQRFITANMMKSFNRVLLLDGGKVGAAGAVGETFNQKTTSFTGVNDAIGRFMNDCAGAADVPLMRLFGQSSGGLGSTGDAESRNYYDHVAARQKRDLKPQLKYLYEIMTRSALGRKPENFAIDFNSLWQLSDTDRAIVEKARAERDEKYTMMGSLTPHAVTRQLKKDNVYSTLEDADVKLAEEMQDRQAELDAAAMANASKGAAGPQQDQPDDSETPAAA